MLFTARGSVQLHLSGLTFPKAFGLWSPCTLYCTMARIKCICNLTTAICYHFSYIPMAPCQLLVHVLLQKRHVRLKCRLYIEVLGHGALPTINRSICNNPMRHQWIHSTTGSGTSTTVHPKKWGKSLSGMLLSKCQYHFIVCSKRVYP